MINRELQKQFKSWTEHLKLIPYSIQVDELRGLIINLGGSIIKEIWLNPNKTIFFQYKRKVYKICVGRDTECKYKRTYSLKEEGE